MVAVKYEIGGFLVIWKAVVLGSSVSGEKNGGGREREGRKEERKEGGA